MRNINTLTEVLFILSFQFGRDWKSVFESFKETLRVA